MTSPGFDPRVGQAFATSTNAYLESGCFCACGLNISEILSDIRISFIFKINSNLLYNDTCHIHNTLSGLS